MPYKSRLPIWIALAIIAALSALDHAGLFGYQGPDRDRYDGANTHIISAIDGSTFEVDLPDGSQEHTCIRLCGVDCSEIARQEDANYSNSACEACDLVQHEIVGRSVRLVMEPNRKARDKNGRLLAYVYLTDSGEMLNELLIDRGLARADQRLDHLLKHEFAEHEKRAIKARAGLWASVTPEKKPDGRQHIETAGSR